MAEWFTRTFVETGRLPLLCFLAGMVSGFAFIRMSVRLIRAKVRWWPGNFTPGGLHIHHVVFGVVFMMIGGVAALAVPDVHEGWRATAAVVFGIGSALVLDEFALILHLRDVYWTEEGRISVDAVFVAIALTGMLLLGLRPLGLDEAATWVAQDEPGAIALTVLVILLDLVLATVTLFKGKVWSGLLGLFVPVLLVVGSLRLARPASPWARWRYRPDTPIGRRKLARARWRERRLRVPVIRVKIWFQELVSGRHDEPSR
ncbi:hypothetical protein [Allokutzneria oryzae]|uniref:Integral membrane protein n=1 Tax=Allokutzneria oryzae TaxID=1378989 RepID=A0ABV5ZVX7_9PSEU